MLKGKGIPCSVLVQCYLILLTIWIVRASASARVVKKQERWPVVSTDYGEISAVRVSDGINGSYLLHFFALEANSVLLPVVLNADMLFYVRAGRGQLSWTEDEQLKNIDLRQGDVHRLLRGTVLYVRSDEAEQERLKIHAIFAHSNDDFHEPETEPYTSLQEMLLGFDSKILQATFKVSEEVIGELLGGTKPAAITHADKFCRGLRRCDIGLLEMNKKKKKDKKEEEEKKKKKKEHSRLFNVFEADREIENCNGWSTTVTGKQLPALEGSNIGLFMVNLAAGSMMGPHWNEMDSEVVVILEGRGMVRVSSSSVSKGSSNSIFEVEEGDVFAVPRFHPTAEMAFNNGSLVYMGFSRMTERNKAQFLAGEASVLQILDRQVLEIALNVQSSTLDELLAGRYDRGAITSCISCAEEEMQTMEEEGGGTEEETGGGDEGRRPEEEESERRHGREEEWRGREHGGEEEQTEEEEESERRHGQEEEWRGREHGGEEEQTEPRRKNRHHSYGGGVRRVLKNN